MILAAGLGSRLGGLSDLRPKPLLPVCDVPLIRYALALLRGHGIADVIVNLHHKGELIEAELGDDVSYSRETRILGTGGGILKAAPFFGGQPFVVANGKIVFDLDLDAVLAHHRATGAVATLVVRADPDAARWGAIDVTADGLVRGMLGPGDHMFTGVHVIDPALLALLPEGESCIVRQGYLPALAKHMRIAAYVAPGYFFEHSTPARYLEGNLNLLLGRATLPHPPSPLRGVHATATVAPGATIAEAALVAAAAVIGEGATIGPGTVIGHHAIIAPGSHLERAIVWPRTTVTAGTYADTILTPDGTFLPKAEQRNFPAR
jgi:NDP-sugar pyrophosphorylase family protein